MKRQRAIKGNSDVSFPATRQIIRQQYRNHGNNYPLGSTIHFPENKMKIGAILALSHWGRQGFHEFRIA